MQVKFRNMTVKNADGKKDEGQSAAAVRASISFPSDVYGTLETIAKRKVSLAWALRRSADQDIGGK